MPIIALLTDFGLQDHYVGAMKGAILGVCPEATLVDLLHEVPPQDVMTGALALEACHLFFPAGTVFLAVVDPGVGSERRAIALAAGPWLFVGPDNGLFTFVLDAHPDARAHLLASPVLQREPVSAVFHGRDLFGPAAGHLARGLPINDVGPPVSDPVRLAAALPTRLADGCEGTVLLCDRFGNLTTSIRRSDLGAVGANGLAATEVTVAGREVPMVRTYSDVAEGDPCALVGSSERLEVAVNRGSARVLLGIGRGASVRVRVRR